MARTQLIASIVASAHLIGVGLTALYVSSSTAGQAPLVWVYWAFVDFPISLLYPALNDNVILVHGVLGTGWWYGLTILLIKALSMLRAMVRRQ